MQLNNSTTILEFSVVHYQATKDDEYDSCLHILDEVVWKHIKGKGLNAATGVRLRTETEIPFTIKIFEKVFLNVDKAEIDEKEESGRDEEDGK